MSLRLRLITDSTIPISVEGVLPQTTATQSHKEIEKIPIVLGATRVCLADLFSVSGTPDSESIIWEGDLKSVNFIGAKLTAGRVIVEGNCGRHLGMQMSGGSITVNGSAGDFVACENRGGTVTISGDAGDWLGAVYMGTVSGANGGEIFVGGNAGHGIGSAMRRGLIAVGKNAGQLVGWNMLAGTICIGGKWGAMSGRGMTRGTLIANNNDFAQENLDQLPMTFTSGGVIDPVFYAMLQRKLSAHQIQFPPALPMRQFHGDHLKGGRGEVFLSSSVVC